MQNEKKEELVSFMAKNGVNKRDYRCPQQCNLPCYSLFKKKNYDLEKFGQNDTFPFILADLYKQRI